MKDVCLLSPAPCDLLEWQGVSSMGLTDWVLWVGKDGMAEDGACQVWGGLVELCCSLSVHILTSATTQNWHFQEIKLFTLWQNIHKTQLSNEYCFPVMGNKTYQQRTLVLPSVLPLKVIGSPWIQELSFRYFVRGIVWNKKSSWKGW